MRWLFCFVPVFLCALPQSPNVIQGGAQMEYGEGSISIQTDGDVWIDWESFSLEQNEKAVFSQPDVSSIALNRVLSS